MAPTVRSATQHQASSYNIHRGPGADPQGPLACRFHLREPIWVLSGWFSEPCYLLLWCSPSPLTPKVFPLPLLGGSQALTGETQWRPPFRHSLSPSLSLPSFYKCVPEEAQKLIQLESVCLLSFSLWHLGYRKLTSEPVLWHEKPQRVCVLIRETQASVVLRGKTTQAATFSNAAL